MSIAELNTFVLNGARLNGSFKVPASISSEMDKQQNTKPVTKIEFIDGSSNVTDITDHYISGAKIAQTKDRKAGELQAGDFDLVMSNQDNKFSEYDSTSLFYGIQYHGEKIRVSEGFILPDGTTSYVTQAVSFIDQIVMDPAQSRCTIRCRDLIAKILDGILNPTPVLLVPVAAAGNVGNGSFPAVAIMPFATINQTWTVTCTLGGGNSTAQFSVVGSISGSIGPATSGTQFTSTASGIQFTISAGTTLWQSGDIFTFTTYQHPEWTSKNPAKIIWSILTGYDWDTNTQEAWSGQVFSFDHTQSTSNTQINYASFVTTSADFDVSGIFNLKGYVPLDSTAVTFIQDLLLLFIGSLFTDNNGNLAIKMFFPVFSSDSFREFSDTKKISQLGYNRSIDEVVNSITVNYKAFDLWEWSSASIIYTGTLVKESAASITKYGRIVETHDMLWYTANGNHVSDFANKLVTRYSEPPLNMDFVTGLDALKTYIGDTVFVTDAKYKLSKVVGEVVIISKNFDENPAHVQMRVRRDPTLNAVFGFWGSTANESDGLSPQSSSYDTASVNDKLFSYLGDGTSTTSLPDYDMF